MYAFVCINVRACVRKCVPSGGFTADRFCLQAKDAGASSNRWLLVNIQNSKEFACQVLNRDVWSNQAVKSIVTEHFVFWQVHTT